MKMTMVTKKIAIDVVMMMMMMMKIAEEVDNRTSAANDRIVMEGWGSPLLVGWQATRPR